MISDFVLRIEESVAATVPRDRGLGNPKHYIKAAVEACAREVEAAGCICCVATVNTGVLVPRRGFTVALDYEGFSDSGRVIEHDPRCPVALADKLRGMES